MCIRNQYSGAVRRGHAHLVRDRSDTHYVQGRLTRKLPTERRRYAEVVGGRPRNDAYVRERGPRRPGQVRRHPDVVDTLAVSYTHLTLPTILRVEISVVAVSLKKKK